ncbi:PhzF family phenazine biosynthesis protein [Paenibacillus nanensis]|uniref:PhzF family phenazine biosynthesis protein n=1 Tax=Paenibacillus nanensis TaxID=393251 RepID=A0A3A1VI79_9BACL|nr:PhzF family phenazine biosynthesis protein [Paenibacillus nanensis]RIX59412.1 PhzF family phenazine biosynthesis protein [Paenibacillus nanensis]
MGMELHIVDAFTKEKFAGNPAAVCVVEQGMADERMAAIAAEMNLSETAFLRKMDGGYELRWFTPKAEVDLCGHATLAGAHTLWETERLGDGEDAVFYTRSGVLTVTRRGEWMDMDFPSEPAEPVTAPKELIEALGLIPRFVGRNRMDFLVEVDSEETVRSLQPDFDLLKRLQARGVIVTSAASRSKHAQQDPGTQYDIVSRAFFPGIGIAEDPVTGSAHCALAPYWGRRLRKEELSGWQASERGGLVRMRLAGERVILSGQAVTVLRGELAD